MKIKNNVVVTSEAERILFNQAHQTLDRMLRFLKRQSLKGGALDTMKVLEEGVQACEAFNILTKSENE